MVKDNADVDEREIEVILSQMHTSLTLVWHVQRLTGRVGVRCPTVAFHRRFGSL